MNAMVSNDNFLKQKMVQGIYRANGITRTEGVLIIAGLTAMGATKSGGRIVNVSFGSGFNTACKPIVTATTIFGGSTDIYPFLRISGPGASAQPNVNGFQIHLTSWADAKKNRKIGNGIYVGWHAVGFG